MPEGAEKKEFARKRKFLQDLTGNKSSGVKKIKREKDADAQVNKGNLRAAGAAALSRVSSSRGVGTSRRTWRPSKQRERTGKTASDSVIIQDDPALNEALYDAANANNHKEVGRLLVQGGNPTWKNPLNGETALHRAVRGNAASTVRKLIKAGANVHAQSKDGWTHVALARSKAVVEALVKAGANVRVTARDGWTPLHRVCFNSLALKGTVTALITAGANVNTPDAAGDTALHVAVRESKNFYRITELVAIGYTPLDVATPAAKLVLKAEMQRVLDWNLWDVTSDGDREEVERLLDEGGNPNWGNPGVMGKTALHIAAIPGDPEIVQRLLARGALVETEDDDGKTALHDAVLVKSTSMLRILIEAGANVNAQDKSGRTPLHYSRSKAVVEALVETGANVGATDKHGDTPLHYACWNEAVEAGTVEALVAAGVNVYAHDEDGDTALHVAARERRDLFRIFELVQGAAGGILESTRSERPQKTHLKRK